ncbi:hypothetical protein ES705_49922 [subsurface metagenome]
MNLVTNGTFDSDMSSWPIRHSGVTWDAAYGGSCKWWDGLGTTLYLYQAIAALVEGKRYKISLDVVGHESPGDSRIASILLGGGDNWDGGLIQTDGHYEGYAICGSETPSIYLVGYSYHYGVSFWIDNITVELVTARPLVGGLLAAGRRGLV